MGTSSCLFLLLVCFLNVKGTQSADKMIIKYTVQFQQTWTDAGSGSKSDMSIWYPLDLEAGYCALGDTAVDSHSKPTNAAVLVKDTGYDLVKPPASFMKMWSDKGSGASKDVTFYRMIPAPGYTCLGHVAVASYTEMPNAAKYRCVKSSLVQPGILYPIWNDKDSGAATDGSLWSVKNSPANPTGVWAQTFLSVANWNKPTETPYLLDSKKASISEYANSDDVAIVLYQTNDVVKVWDDKGSGANKDVSIWRAFHCCSLGYRAVSNSQEPFAVYAKEIKSGALAKPKGFTKVWDDTKSGADKDVAIWSLECPTTYVALGCAATASHSAQPSVDDLRCVHMDYVLPGEWTKIWDDAGSGAKDDVTIWQANALNFLGQPVFTMSAVKRHGEMFFPALVLKSINARVESNKPVKRAIIYGVTYNFNDRNILQTEPIDLGARTIINNCKGNGSVLTVSRTLTFTVTTESSWSYETSIGIGVTVEMSASVPELFTAKASTTHTFSFNSGEAGSYTESNTDSLTAAMSANSGSSEAYFIMGKKYLMTLPWEGYLKTTFEDDKEQVDKIKGTYEGVHVSEFTVTSAGQQPCT